MFLRSFVKNNLLFRSMDPLKRKSPSPYYQGITVRLGAESVGAIGFMSIRNKYGRTLVNPNFCSADTHPGKPHV